MHESGREVSFLGLSSPFCETGLSQLRKTGRLSHSSFHRRGVHFVGLLFLIWKTALALVKVDAWNAPSCKARLTMTLMKQKINLLVGVKKKMVLEGRLSAMIYKRDE